MVDVLFDCDEADAITLGFNDWLAFYQRICCGARGIDRRIRADSPEVIGVPTRFRALREI